MRDSLSQLLSRQGVHHSVGVLLVQGGAEGEDVLQRLAGLQGDPPGVQVVVLSPDWK